MRADVADRLAHHMRAAWNMVFAAEEVVTCFRRMRLVLSLSMLTTAWVTARLPAVSSTKTRVAGLLPRVELLELADIVDARIGAGVGGHDKALVEQHSNAIGHESGPWAESCLVLLLGDLDADFNPHPLAPFPPRRKPRIGVTPAASIPAATRT
jgi:hypothetical protein